MCRWFAYISPDEPCLLADVLILPKHSLTQQVHDHYLPKLLAHLPNTITARHEADARNRLFNIDGLGVCWYTPCFSDFQRGNTGRGEDGLSHKGLRPATYKSIQPPSGDSNFHSICANTETTCCFAHIRATSATSVMQTNNHPFIFGRLALMHNGVVSDFVSIKRAVSEILNEDVYANIKGSTDSEHLAALFVHYLTHNRGKESWEEDYTVRQMAIALHDAAETIIELQAKILGKDAKPNSFNLAVTDGTKLVAYRFRNHAEEQPPSLYYSTKAGVTLNRKYPDHPDGAELAHDDRASRKDADQHGRHVIVASEPSTYKVDDWLLIGKNQALLVDMEGKPTIEDIPYDKSWNAQDEVPKH